MCSIRQRRTNQILWLRQPDICVVWPTREEPAVQYYGSCYPQGIRTIRKLVAISDRAPGPTDTTGAKIEPLLASQSVAFKEWAVICSRLRSGQQTIILRKGGIHEGREGFRVSHSEFWLLPTQFHTQPDALRPELLADLQQVAREQPPPGRLRLRDYARVVAVHELTELAQVERLAGLHGWSDETVANRFHYRQPGLFLLLVRIWTQPEPIEFDDSPEIAGCKSWVSLPTAFVTDQLQPVLSDAQFAVCRQQIADRLFSPAGGSL